MVDKSIGGALSQGLCGNVDAGASEPRNLAYMERLGLWGVGNSSFASFGEFLQAIGNKGVAALELVAMDMKARGMYVCRTLSFEGKFLFGNGRALTVQEETGGRVPKVHRIHHPVCFVLFFFFFFLDPCWLPVVHNYHWSVLRRR